MFVNLLTKGIQAERSVKESVQSVELIQDDQQTTTKLLVCTVDLMIVGSFYLVSCMHTE